jgi:hypothetical protein
MLEHLNVQLTEEEGGLFNNALNETLAINALRSPRDINRLINALLLPVLTTREEVTFADVLLYQILELKFNSIAQKIKTSPEEFIAGFEQSLAARLISASSDAEKKARDEFLSELLSPYEEKEKKEAKSIIKFLFPKLMGSMFDQNQGVVNRIHSEPALNTLLHSGINRFNVSSKVAKHVLSSTDDRPQVLSDMLESNDLNEWLIQIKVHFKDGIKDPEDLVEKLLKLTSEAFTEKKMNIVDEIGYFICEIIKVLSGSQQQSILSNVVSAEKHIDVAERVLLVLLESENMWHGGTYYPPSEASKVLNHQTELDHNWLEEQKNIWLKTIKRASIENPDLILCSPEVTGILFRWGQFEENSYSSVKAFLTELTSTEEGVRKFIQVMPKIIDHHDSGLVAFVEDVPEMIKKLEVVKDDPKSKVITKYLEAIQAKRDEGKTSDVSRT